MNQNNLTGAFGAPQAVLTRGSGCYVFDQSGKKYLDFLGGIAVNALGHAHPALAKALAEQAGTLIHISNFFVSDVQLELSARLAGLCDLGDPSEAFFTNSGTEANEAAFKMVRLWGKPRGLSRVIALEGAFHGRTMGALALTAKEVYREPFVPLPGPVTFIKPDVAALEEALAPGDVAAVFVEPIQGELGVRPLPEGFLQASRRLTLENDALLVIDEVQTGIGRTGTWLAQHELDGEGVRGDIVTLAKGLGGGVPIGAAVAGPRAAGLLYPGSHGTTFGGNPLASRAALTVLDTIDSEHLLERAKRMGRLLRDAIASLNDARISHVTGAGLLLGIQLTEPIAPQVVKESLDLGLIVNAPAGTTVRLAPPLIVGEPEVEQFTRLFAEALSAVKN